MKRYVNTIIILCVAILGIGGLFVNIAVTDAKLPQFEIRTTDGDEKESEPIMISGEYLYHGQNERLKITKNNTEYLNQNSILEELLLSDTPNEISKLRKEYKQFMRGKDSIDHFYEDNDFLAHADIFYKYSNVGKSSNFNLTIALLEKKDRKVTEFKLPLPTDSETYSYITVEDVQLVNSELKVAVQASKDTVNGYIEEKRLYTINLTNKKILSDELIFSFESSQEFSTVIQLVPETNLSQPRKKLLYTIIKGNHEAYAYDNGESQESEIIDYSVISLDYETNKVETIDLPNKLKTGNEVPTPYTDGNYLYFGLTNTNSVTITAFEIDSQKITTEYSLPLNKVREDLKVSMKDNRLYVLDIPLREETKSKPAVLTIADLSKGNILFKGEVNTKKHSKNGSKKDDLFLYNLEID